MTDFSVDVRRDGSTCMVVVAGEVDLQNSECLALIGRMALEAVSGDEALVLDLTAVSFIDSMGLGALVEINNEARVNGHLVRLRGVQPIVNRVLELGGLTGVFGVEHAAGAQQ